jgi:hypothetical protein
VVEASRLPQALEGDARDGRAAISTRSNTSAKRRSRLSDPKNDEISATATTQDETRRGEMLENRGDVKM